MCTPRLRRFALLVLGMAAFLAWGVLAPTRLWASSMLVVYVALLLWVCWRVARDPWH